MHSATARAKTLGTGLSIVPAGQSRNSSLFVLFVVGLCVGSLAMVSGFAPRGTAPAASSHLTRIQTASPIQIQIPTPIPMPFAVVVAPPPKAGHRGNSRLSASNNINNNWEPVEPDSSQVNNGGPMDRDDDPYIEIQYESYFDGTKPDSSWNLAWANFVKQGTALSQQGLEGLGAKEKSPSLPECLGLKLSNAAVTETEMRRIERGGGVENVHPVSKLLYDTGCWFLDQLFDDRPIQRFWFLETIARIPYFSYVSMLHLYESFGWFRAVELRKVHAAEDWNELHHLLIMESLGGNRQWSDRFLGYHVALAYYWFLVAVYLGSPRIAYQFMELLEAHAVDTYSTFVNENRERLKELPPPVVASGYYRWGDLYLFDDFMTTRKPGSRRPPCDTLLDVFENICTDEGEHVKTMKACQDYASFGTRVVSPHLRFRDTGGTDGNSERERTEAEILTSLESKRNQWKEWSESINNENKQDGNERIGKEEEEELQGTVNRSDDELRP